MTLSGVRQFIRAFAVSVLIPLLGAQTHVVSPQDLNRAAVEASSARQHHLDTIQRFLSSPKAEKVLGAAGIDPARVSAAVSSLSDQELARLAARSDKIQADFAAGRLSDRDLILVLLAVVVLILVIVAVR